MKVIEKKIYPPYFSFLRDNRKTFELRINDFECDEGDTITFREYIPIIGYTGRETTKTVGYVLKGNYQDLIKYFGRDKVEQHGLQIISLNNPTISGAHGTQSDK